MTWRQNKVKYGDAIVSDTPDGCRFPCLKDEDFRFYGGHLVCESVSEEHARRIVACVNACEGVSTEALEELIASGGRVVPEVKK